MDDIDILLGDSLESLRDLPDGCVQTCVTSPPYFGLRDYGTGTWTGGDPACDHVVGEMRRGLGLAGSAASTRGGGKKVAETADIQARAICPHCGATREDQQVGLEETPEAYIERLVLLFREVRRVLRHDGTLWVNIGDSYANIGHAKGNRGSGIAGAGHRATEPSYRKTGGAGVKNKDLLGVPWMLAFALRADGWYLRQDNIWHKPNPMPESVTDRCTKSHEYVFLFSKSATYFFDSDAIREPGVVPAGTKGAKGSVERAAMAGVNSRPPEYKVYDGTRNKRSVWTADDAPRKRGVPPYHAQYASSNQSGLDDCPRGEGRNKRSVWTVATRPYPGAHFATFPPDLIEPCVLAGTSEHGGCAHCGAPFERITERTKVFKGGSGKAGRTAEDANANGKWAGVQYGRDIKLGPALEIQTLGWEPTCGCPEHDPVPQIVLDPFGGAGTTGLVARQHGRRAILCELNPEYVVLTYRRLGRPGMSDAFDAMKRALARVTKNIRTLLPAEEDDL